MILIWSLIGDAPQQISAFLLAPFGLAEEVVTVGCPVRSGEVLSHGPI
jgi:hypothetical protein